MSADEAAYWRELWQKTANGLLAAHAEIETLKKELRIQDEANDILTRDLRTQSEIVSRQATEIRKLLEEGETFTDINPWPWRHPSTPTMICDAAVRGAGEAGELPWETKCDKCGNKSSIGKGRNMKCYCGGVCRDIYDLQKS